MQHPKKTRRSVLHLTTHLGGGIGSVVLNYLRHASSDQEFDHKVICLGYIDPHTKQTLRELHVPFIEHLGRTRHAEALREIERSDIVLVHWWNHPLLSDFLMRNPLPPSRVVFWSHVLGNSAPNNFTAAILGYPDLFVFTTPLSYEVPEVKEARTIQPDRFKDIWSTGTAEKASRLRAQPHPGIVIGYTGTVDSAKMHPDFIKLCAAADIPDARFVVIGPSSDTRLQEEAARLGIAQQFEFTGPLPRAQTLQRLTEFDIFGYPLTPGHYGTCDLTLQESMAAGVVPVVLANDMERFMVKDGVTGIVANDTNAYIRALEVLAKDHPLRERLAQNARAYASNTFSLARMAHEWSAVFHGLLSLPKTARQWPHPGARTFTPAEIFLESLGHQGGPFQSYKDAPSAAARAQALMHIRALAKDSAWQSETKSTVHNFNTFLPGDPDLELWSREMRDARDTL